MTYVNIWNVKAQKHWVKYSSYDVLLYNQRSACYLKYAYCNAVDRIQHGIVTAIPISVSQTRWENNIFYIWKQNADTEHIFTKHNYLCNEWWSISMAYVDALEFGSLSWHRRSKYCPTPNHGSRSIPWLIEAEWRIYASVSWPSSVLIMACRLDGAKPLSYPMLGYYQLDLCEQTSVKSWSKRIHFNSWKCVWKCRQGNGGHFVSASMC